MEDYKLYDETNPFLSNLLWSQIFITGIKAIIITVVMGMGKVLSYKLHLFVMNIYCNGRYLNSY